jgi:starch-binding outer membrane protein, SusD/RagB family
MMIPTQKTHRKQIVATNNNHKKYSLMKKYLIVLLTIPILMFISCEKQLDSIKPIGTQTEVDQFATAEGAELALLAAYNVQALYEFDLNIFDCYGDLGMGLSTATSSWHAALGGNLLPNDHFIGDTWKWYYQQINQINTFLRNMEEYKPRFTPESRRYAAIGEARALRGLAYFMLVQTFGPVPLITEENMTNLYPSRKPEIDVYNQIIADLDYAIEHLTADFPSKILDRNSNAIEWGRITKYAAVAMKGKVLLTAPEPLRNNSAAASLFLQVIQSNKFGMLPHWPNVFNPDFRTNNPESIWPIMYTNAYQGGGSKLAHYATSQQSWFRPFNWFYDMYEEEDVRRDATILKGWRDNFLEKYMQGLSGDERDNHPFYNLRYPDVLLMRAEALAKENFQANKTEVVGLLNQVRDRAKASLYEEADFPTVDSFFEKLMDEYHLEFYFEFHTWYTFKRFGIERTFQRQKIELNDQTRYKIYAPLPGPELLKNPNLEQNEGYATE